MLDNLNTRDTIVAIATPFGTAGIGIIRISGANALEIAKTIFKPTTPFKEIESHRLYLGEVMDPTSGNILDQVLLSFMKAPHSFTREDVIEINSHSGHTLLQKIIQIIINEGARLAKPGEFTYRAFLNGRIDLTQAEAVIDLINAKSEKGIFLAARQITGVLKDEMEQLRKNVIDILAHIEVVIDFPEDESNILPRAETALRIEKEIIRTIEKITASYTMRKLWMEGIHTIIAGRVNAGKSSLFNRLLNEQRAIVTPIPGTTRDTIESNIDLEGIPLLLMDTAGIRKVRGQVEKIGVHRSEQKLAEADLVLIVIDQSRLLNKDDMNIISKIHHKNALIVINKIDLPKKINETQLKSITKHFHQVRISALTGEGIKELYTAIRENILSRNEDLTLTPIAPNLRHQRALTEASRNFKKAACNMKEDVPWEIIAVDLHSGLETLGTITGETNDEAIYKKIFSNFCLGK
jgi:tRNA modification GTPase